MRILYLITGLGLGGAERQVVDLADHYASRGARVMIVYLTGAARLHPSSPDIEVLGIGMERSVTSLVQAFFRIRRLVLAFRPDVVHSHMVHANLLARLVRLITPMPRLVCTAHSTNEGGRMRMLGYRVTHRLADVTTSVTREAARALVARLAAPGGGIVAVVNGIDTDRYRPCAEERQRLRQDEMVRPDEKVILAAGRLVKEKDYGNLLLAFSMLRKTRERCSLWIAGEGPLLLELQGLADRLGISERVRFLGARSDTPALFNAADVFVLASKWEGFGLVVAEAMATEKVVVATDCGGVREVLGDCGYLVPPGAADLLCEALLQALSMDQRDAAVLGRRARQRIREHYSLECVANIWSQIYEGKCSHV